MSYESQRAQMVDRDLRRRGIRAQRVLDVMSWLPREEFVPPDLRHLAYRDEPIEIGAGQTISQPYIVALMAQSLELRGDERVLDVGSGSGYHAAVLGQLAARIISIELIPELAEMAHENLARTRLDGNIQVLQGDGSKGYPVLAPYDAISVAAGAPDTPAELLRQLREPGRMIIPLGPSQDQELRLIVKSGGNIENRLVTLCRFVPLLGEQGWR